MNIEPIPHQAAEAIEKVRGLVRSLSLQVEDYQVEPVDVLIGIIYGAHDLAARMTGTPIAGVEWHRNALDVIERSVLSGGPIYVSNKPN